jgi:uncharacterized membrane protein YcaP (DUF421 family)
MSFGPDSKLQVVRATTPAYAFLPVSGRLAQSLSAPKTPYRPLRVSNRGLCVGSSSDYGCMEVEHLGIGIAIARTLTFYAVLLLLLRVMGKREIGSLSPFDLVVTIMIAELAALPMENPDITLLDAMVPILTLTVAEITVSYITLKSEAVRLLLTGTPSIIIRGGEIIESEMRRIRYNLSDLMLQLRLKGVSNIADVEVAILETNGELSVILKSQRRPLVPADLDVETDYEGLPLIIIVDGVANKFNLRQAGLDDKWLAARLRERGIESVDEVLLASLDTVGRLFVQRKNRSRRKKRADIL